MPDRRRRSNRRCSLPPRRRTANRLDLNSADAQTYNADFAEDVMWGSPYGATVIGYDTLHSIHRGMFERGVAVAGASGPTMVARRGPEHSHSPEDVTCVFVPSDNSLPLSAMHPYSR
jgi:hypothetical protein